MGAAPGVDGLGGIAVYSRRGYERERTASAMFQSGLVEASTSDVLTIGGVGLREPCSSNPTLVVRASIGVALLVHRRVVRGAQEGLCDVRPW